MVVRNRHGAEIRSVSEWRELAPPASPKHWKDGRSAKELAKAWTSGSGPRALAELLDLHPHTRELQIDSAIAEAQTAFDRFPGGKRNHDLLIRGTCASGPIVIGLEAKADETFGETIASYRSKALAVRSEGGSTNAPERLDNLLADVGLISLERNPALGDLRYQLFSAVAGTLAAAESGDLASFVVHEFLTDQTSEAKRLENKKALAAFVADVADAVTPETENWVLGPFHVPAERWSRIRLYIAHMTTAGTST